MGKQSMIVRWMAETLRHTQHGYEGFEVTDTYKPCCY